MKKHAPVLLVSLAVLLCTAVLTACGSPAEVPPGLPAPGLRLSLSGDACPGVEIRANDQVTWTNADNANHPIEIQYPNGETYLAGGELRPGDSFTFTFPEAGDFIYSCTEGGPANGVIKVNP